MDGWKERREHPLAGLAGSGLMQAGALPLPEVLVQAGGSMARVGDISRGETEPRVTSEPGPLLETLLYYYRRQNRGNLFPQHLEPKKQEEEGHPLVPTGAMRADR